MQRTQEFIPLWHSQALQNTLRQQLKDSETPAAAMVENARRRAESSLEETLLPDLDNHGQAKLRGGEEYCVACAASYLFTGESDYALKAVDSFFFATHAGSPSDLRFGKWGLTGAIIMECCFDAIDESRQLKLASLVHSLHNAIYQVRKGNPHTVTNNWWAITHCGSLCAGLALLNRVTQLQKLGLSQKPKSEDQSSSISLNTSGLDESVHFVKQRLRPFCSHFGDEGIYQEGTGYQGYVTSFLFPTLFAIRSFFGEDWIEDFPGLKRTALSTMIQANTKCSESDSAEEHSDTESMPKRIECVGSTISWNDSGQGSQGCGASALMIQAADSKEQGALRALFDLYYGPKGSNRYAEELFGTYFNPLFYPYDAPLENPNVTLPKHICDSRQGLAVFRNVYHDKDDAVLGVYARVTHVGGHSQDDGGSLRFMALGQDWILGGGQARPKAEFQSTAMRANEDRASYGCGAVMWNETLPHGGLFAMDLRKVSGSYHERYIGVDFSTRLKVPVAMALLDQINDHRQEDWLWNLSFSDQLELDIDKNLGGFTLHAKDGSSMRASFLGAEASLIECKQMPESQRRYSSGGLSRYKGRPYIQARFSGREKLGIYTLFTVQKGEAPEVKLQEGVSVTVNGKLWERPLGHAVPLNFLLGLSGGLCHKPDGKP